jgi:phage baseplate assembly protein W
VSLAELDWVKYKMATFIGFNTINQNKKFTLLDFELVKRDLANALNIKQGEMPGLPSYGTTLWGFLFENQSPEMETAILNEIQRVASQDPRLYIVSAELYPQNNGLRIEMQVQVVPSAETQLLALFLNQQTQQATLI